ncbi:hypothetical protein ACFHW2_25670 [Actinomadura sp. LOL_016]|uniref:hypothetical protein n=1 Tax=unclassified Actinomadura TaxID=2626254 RepID=UPI003A812231
MPQTRSATSNGVVLALIMVGGALATGVAIVFTIVRNYMSPDMVEFRTSTTFFLIECFFVGAVVGSMLLFTRPRGPLAPLAAAVAAYVALEVGIRIGAYMTPIVSFGDFPGTGPLGDLLQPVFTKFQAYELLASLVAAGLALAKVMTASSGGTNQPYGAPGQPFGAPGQPMPGQPMPGQPMPGQPMPGQPMPGQPMPGQPMPGQPMPGQALPGQPMHGQQPYPGPGAPGAPDAGQPPSYGPPAPGPSGWAPGQPIEPPPAPGGPRPGA